MTTTINPAELQAKFAADPSLKLIDVRTPAEFGHQRAEKAVNVPLDQFDAQAVINQHNLSSDQPVYLICKMGGRSQKACNLLASAGFDSAVNVTGGTDRWVAENLPAITIGKKPFSIMRQVQITAGSLVLLGIGLSFLHPWWLGLSAFVGAGLVFAGLSDTCAMGQMLGMMPWNKSKPDNRLNVAKPESTPVQETPVQSPQPEPTADCDSGG
jgi:rhodanese-related sulfurtransferase